MSLKSRILLFLKPIQKWLQRLGYQETHFTPEIIKQLLLTIKAGDVLLSYETGRFTSWFIKGDYKHAAIVDENMYVVEAVGEGVRRVPLEKWLWTKYHVAILRHYHLPTAKFAALETKKHIGKAYDYAFSFNNEILYCSELVYVCFKQFDTTFMDFIPKHKEILPIDYFKEDNLKVIYNSMVWVNP